MAEEELELAETGGSKKKLFILIGIVVLVLLIAGAAAMYFMGMFGSDEEADGGAEEAAQEEVIKEAIYVALDPKFTVNLQSGSKSKYLQIAVQALVRDPDLEEALKTHEPAIRSQLLLLFSSKTSQELSSLEGKQALQTEALETIQKVIKDAANLEGIESVLFTSFVMQ